MQQGLGERCFAYQYNQGFPIQAYEYLSPSVAVAWFVCVCVDVHRGIAVRSVPSVPKCGSKNGELISKHY